LRPGSRQAFTATRFPVGVVTAGSFVFQIEGGPTRILHTGDSFFEPAGRTIVKFDNASRTARAAITVFYLTDSKARPLIEPIKRQ